MAKQQTDEELGLDVERHPGTGKWRWIWVSPGGSEHIGTWINDTEMQARRAGRAFATPRLKAMR